LRAASIGAKLDLNHLRWLGIPEYNSWNEALHGVARSGYRDGVPTGDRHRGHVG
jgi:hypothetical protein